MIASKDELMKALELCANGCNDDGCIYLEEQNSRGGLAVVRCVDLMAQDALELLKEQHTEIERLKAQLVASDDDIDYCYECRGLGSDYSVNDDGELVDNCTDCPFNPSRNDDD